MKKCRNNLMAVLLAVIMILCAIPFEVGAMDAKKNDLARARKFLLNNGWTNDEIEDLLDEDALLAFANAEYVVESEKKYFHVTEDDVREITKKECDIAMSKVNIQNDDIVKTTAITEYSINSDDDYATIDTVVTADGYMEYYVRSYWLGDGFIMSSRFEWLTSPIYTKKDIFGIAHSITLVTDDDFDVYFVYKATVHEQMPFYSNSWEYQTEQPTLLDVTGRGVFATFQVYPTTYYSNINYLRYATNHRGYIQYKAKIAMSNAESFSAAAYYYQWRSSIQPSVSFSLSVTGVDFDVSFSPNQGYYKLMEDNPQILFY